jgi:polygalacturonase
MMKLMPIALISLLAVASPDTPVGTGVYSVLDYGADGTGTHDDTTAIQKTVDVCAAAGGGRVLLPAA